MMESSNIFSVEISDGKKEINIQNKGIEGSIDLSDYVYLHKLDCSNNQITKISGLTALIKWLDCSNNLIEKFIIHSQMIYCNYSNNPIKELTVLKEKLPDTIPTTVTHLFLGSEFIFPVENLHKGLECIKFGFKFKEPIDNLQGPDKELHSIREIHFGIGSRFNQPIDNLPTTLEELELGYAFNQPIDNLPDGLLVLEFSEHSEFNQRLDNLPESLEKLIFCNYSFSKFNQPINNLPTSLQHLVLGISFSHPIDNLPNGLKYLEINSSYSQEINNLPDSIEKISVRRVEQKKLFNQKYHRLLDL